MYTHIQLLSDGALVLHLGNTISKESHETVLAAETALEHARIAGVISLVPSYTTVTVYYDPTQIRAVELESSIVQAIANISVQRHAEPRLHCVPVCYGGDFGPDLDTIANHCGITPSEVITLHSGAEYRVHAVGFMPGFPYLSGLPQCLHMPRRATPRQKVPPGSVAVGGGQTGIYPVTSPGGWNLIGITPWRIFDASFQPPARFRVGDVVQFAPITPDQFERTQPNSDWDTSA